MVNRPATTSDLHSGPLPADDSSTLASPYSPNAYHPDDSIGFLLKRVHNALSRTIESRMSDYGLTDAQWGPLLMIRRGFASTAADAACIADTDTGALTRTIDRLEAKGLVRRIRSSEDRRVVRLELTADGERAADEVPRVICRVLNEFVRGFDSGELEGLKRLLRRMLDNAGVAHRVEDVLAERRGPGSST